jgi:urea transport system permease protein
MTSILIMQAFSGLSLVSVLLLMALGLAVIFGLMGVINMAHGELMTIGAYTTYLVSIFFSRFLPSIFPLYFFIALILAFAVTFLAGLLLERFMIRHLYARPLDTLLATWGLSLLLQQIFRSVFGGQELTVRTPEWLLGALQVTETVEIPRIGIVVMILSIAATASVFYLLFKTHWGLKVRAVTQIREISRAVGINTRQVDSLTFSMGSGLAGIAGCAFTFLGSTGPMAGQLYIVDTFLVVVFGGIQSLMGTIVSAFAIAETQSTLEFFITGSMAKVLTLSAVIITLYFKPDGLFSFKSRK